MEVIGANLAYRLVGDASRPLIITLHVGRGLGSHGSDFTAYKSLSDRYRVLSFDKRGHGVSSVTPPFTFQQLVDDINCIREKIVGDEKVISLGGSFGGFLAQQYVLTYPQTVSHLILLGTVPSHHHETEAHEQFKSRLHLAPMDSVSMLIKVFSAFKDDNELRVAFFAINRLYYANYDPDVGLEKNRSTSHRAEVHNELYSERETYFDYRERLRSVIAPTLILVGENDWVYTPSRSLLSSRLSPFGPAIDQSRLIAEKIPASTLLVVPNANHAVHHDQNGVVIEAICEFLIK
ncbi:Alpha/Beta hydrolase protein [Naematelia encephala]|uniref:Alpha/Beta hydrolase protein n=1 Tax=Naematelia encephala TaxID=71784 RepID=A0A1Y2AU00_9TREE|nr:Alpha/Beta hydrolase protein [Naematelia encephala]